MAALAVTTSSPPGTLSPPVAPGTVLAAKYRVERIIGQGGMGLVVEARHIALDERVALKFLLPEYASHPEASSRFLREARAAVKIKSEHVARVSDVGTLETGAPYMVMEFLEGADLAKILETRTLAIPEAIDYLVQACEAIAEAHSHGIVHRDLKPANLFLTRRQDGFPLVKVLDFGISKTMGNVENLTKTMAAMGSALYMSPEQMQQTRSVDHRTDIYALGVSLYELLVGKQPFYADTLPQLCAEILTGIPTPIRAARPDVSDTLAAVIEKAYARDRVYRYGSIAEFVVALAPWAPAISRNTIERIARMGGMQAPPVEDRAPLPAPALPQAPSSGVTGSQPSQPQIVLAPYVGPASARAAAAFAQHAGSTNTSLSTTGNARSPASRGALFVSLAVGIVAALVIVGVLVTRRGAADPAASASTDEPVAPVSTIAATPTTSVPTPTATASAVASATSDVSQPEPPEASTPRGAPSVTASATAAPRAPVVRAPPPRAPVRAPEYRPPAPPAPGQGIGDIPQGRF